MREESETEKKKNNEKKFSWGYFMDRKKNRQKLN